MFKRYPPRVDTFSIDYMLAHVQVYITVYVYTYCISLLHYTGYVYMIVYVPFLGDIPVVCVTLTKRTNMIHN